MKRFERVMLYSSLACVLSLMLVAATGNRYTGRDMVFTYDLEHGGPAAVTDLIASQTDTETQAQFDAPQDLTLLSVQVMCDTITGGDGITFEIMEGAASNGSVNVGAAADGDPQFMTLTDTDIDDEDEVTITYTSAAGETADDCVVTIIAAPR